MISKSERTELKSVVRQQFKVLKAEVKQREAELRSEANEALVAETGAEDRQWEAIQHIADEAVRAANRAINDGLRAQGMESPEPGMEYRLVDLNWKFGNLRKKTDTGVARQRLELDIRERVRRAGLAIERQEADLLRTLAVDALESEEARAFLATIPTVGELVPSSRLGELLQGTVELGES